MKEPAAPSGAVAVDPQEPRCVCGGDVNWYRPCKTIWQLIVKAKHRQTLDVLWVGSGSL